MGKGLNRAINCSSFDVNNVNNHSLCINDVKKCLNQQSVN